MSDEKGLSIQQINNEVEIQLQDKEVLATLVETTFKGLEPQNIKKAMVEGMIRGFTFKDFLEKKVYALPYNDNHSGKQVYSLITSIDYARRVGSRAGIVGKDAPVFTKDENGFVEACKITVHKKVPGDSYVGDFSAEVFFAEYVKLYNGKPQGLWASKPRTMLAKVAEMHALRMACPEELAQTYVQEEMEKTAEEKQEHVLVYDVDEYRISLESAGSLEELQQRWSPVPGEVKTKLEGLKDELKAKFSKIV